MAHTATWINLLVDMALGGGALNNGFGQILSAEFQASGYPRL